MPSIWIGRRSFFLISQKSRNSAAFKTTGKRYKPAGWVGRFESLERLGESGATHDSQSASRSGVEAWVARNLNGWDDSDAGLSQAWVRCPSGLASLHHSRLSTRSSYQLYSFSGDRRFCYDNHGSFVYDSPNLFCGPSGSVRTGLTAVRSESGHRTHLTSLICRSRSSGQRAQGSVRRCKVSIQITENELSAAACYSIHEKYSFSSAISDYSRIFEQFVSTLVICGLSDRSAERTHRSEATKLSVARMPEQRQAGQNFGDPMGHQHHHYNIYLKRITQ